ncbi:sirohydrochlorin chelatase [Staphylococcus sp. 17KM0847]|nr:sirohydrochlorin chelatase [Staphylococcus sp. 17KM0847]
MRKGKLNQTLEHFVHHLFKGTYIAYDVAFLESEIKSLDDVIKDNVQQGYDKINLVPLLLFTASHYYEDIVEKMKVWQACYHYVSFQLAEPLGTHPYMTDWVASQLSHHADDIDEETGIVILAHGNKRFDEPDRALTSIAKQLSDTEYHCYPSMVYGALNFYETLPFIAKQYEKLLIVPFFFFDGYLVNKTKRQIDDMALPCEVAYTSAINFDPILKKIILERIATCEEAQYVSSTVKLAR